MNIKYLLLSLMAALLLLSSCSKEDEHEFPPVKMDFLTVQTGAGAEFVKAQTDDYTVYDVLEAKKLPDFKPQLSYRVLANYQLIEKEGRQGLKIYGCSPVFSGAPVKLSESFPQDPVEVSAVWPGACFLNLVVYVRTNGGKHLFGVVEEGVVRQGDTAEIHLRLLHDAKNDTPDYRRRYFCSFPLTAYTGGMKQMKVFLKLNTYGEGEKEYQISFNSIPPFSTRVFPGR